MSSTAKKGELFVKEVMNRLKGDDNAALANKIGRKAVSAFDGQIASLKSRLVDDENTLEEAQEALKDTIYPTAMFSNNQAYCQSIVNAQQTVEAAENILKNTQDSIKFFEELLEKI